MSHKSPETTALPPPADVGSHVASNAAADGAVPPLPSAAAQQPTKSVWALVVGTFTEGDANAAALKMIGEMQKIAPSVTGLRAFPTPRGSMVIFGEYAARDDKQARDDIAWLKSLKFQDRPVFPRVMLTQLDLRPLQPELHPWDLRSARREHPKMHPLYTIDVAMWDDFGSGKISYDEIRRDAENYTAQLRTRGFEAYFYHDDVAQRSIVTVGLFDRHAINEISGLWSDEVMDIMKRIPERLVNGAPMGELKDRFRPQMGIKSQTPVLAEVPDT